jgi:uncharacterized membrane protein YdbT with pleckstrin-like domain
MSNDIQLNSGEEVVVQTRPAVKSFWVFFFGILLLTIGPLYKADAPIRPLTGAIFALIFLVIILRRWSEVYTITNQRIMVRGGLVMRETYTMNLADVKEVRGNQGINLRLVGAGHIMISSARPDQGPFIMYGQDKPDEMKRTIDRLAEKAGASLQSEQ